MSFPLQAFLQDAPSFSKGEWHSKKNWQVDYAVSKLVEVFPFVLLSFFVLFLFLEYHFVCDDYSWLFVFWGASKLYGILHLVRLFTFYLKYHLAEVQRTWGQATIQGRHYNVHLIYLKRLIVSFTLFWMNMRKHPLHLNESTILWGACFRGASFETSKLWIAKKATSKMLYSIFFKFTKLLSR